MMDGEGGGSGWEEGEKCSSGHSAGEKIVSLQLALGCGLVLDAIRTAIRRRC